MKYVSLGKLDKKVSQIGLGTVEIGLPYGIGISTLPTEKEAENILKSAIEMGVTYIDTARGYGVAEERIGKSGIGKNPQVLIGTKCAQFLEKGEDFRGEELEVKIRQEIETSLTNLQTESLQLVQLHGGSEEQIERGELMEIMQQLITEGKVQAVGIATRGTEAPLAAMASRFFVTIQTAYSILDQRMALEVLPQAQTQGVGIINRSVLLKGTLSPAAEKLPDALAPLKINSKKAAAIAAKLGIDLPTLAMRFVLSNPAVSTALIGTIHPTELQTAINAAEEGPLSEDVLQELYQLAIDDPMQVDPGNWPKS